MKTTISDNINHELAALTEGISNKIVTCHGCTKCCEKGLVYVLPNEDIKLKEIGVPLIQIRGITFIQRKSDGSCPMLDKVKKCCTIYENRPLCCRAFPLDILSRNGRAEWAIYSYCPNDRILQITDKEGKAELNLDTLSYLTSSVEDHISDDVLEFLLNEDKVASEIEILDDHRDMYKVIGPIY